MVIVPLDPHLDHLGSCRRWEAGESLGRLFSKTLGYYVLSSTLAAILAGLVMVNMIQSGRGCQYRRQSRQAAIPGAVSTPSSPVELLLRDRSCRMSWLRQPSPNMLAVIFFSIVCSG